MQLQSTKSESGSEKQANKWRLRRTLKRQVSYRPIEAEDIRYVYATYKQSGLSTLGFEGKELSPEEFKSKFEQVIVTNCDGCWILSAPTKRGKIPVGMITASWAPLQAYLIVTCIVWFPWASKRNVVEGVVYFFNKAREEFKFMGFALPEHKKAYEICAKHGIARRVGTSRIVIPGQDCAVFESLEPRKYVESVRR